MTDHNATFHCFKPRGKWYTSARGVLPRSVHEPYYQGGADARPKIHAANNGCMPGLSGTADYFIVVVVPDEEVDFGYPVLMHPEVTE